MTKANPTSAEVRVEVRRIIDSEAFAGKPRLVQLLEYLVEETLAGRGGQLKAYSIGIDVFGRPDSFDPATDAIVRVQAARLRDALHQFYGAQKQGLCLSLLKGSYSIQFERISTGSDADQGIPKLSPTRIGSLPSGPHDVWSWLVRLTSAALQFQWRQQLAWMRRPELVGLGLACVAVLLLVGLSSRQNTKQPAINSLALVPFHTAAGEHHAQQIARDMKNELAALLVKSGDFSIKIGARPDAGPPTAEKVQAIGRELNVRWLLTGLVTTMDGAIQLDVFVADTFSGTLVRFDRYNFEQIDVRSSAINVLSEQRAHLMGAMRGALESRVSRSSDPFDLFVLANWAWGSRHSSLEWERERIALARAAVSRDPRFGLAYSVLADKLAFLAKIDKNWRTPALALEAKEAERKALEFSPGSSEALFNSAFYHFHSGRMKEAFDLFQRTLELNPAHAAASMQHQRLRAVCEHSEPVLRELELAAKHLEPGSPLRWNILGVLMQHYIFSGRLEEALVVGKSSIRDFSNPEIILWLAVLMANMGRPKEATELIEREKRN